MFFRYKLRLYQLFKWDYMYTLDRLLH